MKDIVLFIVVFFCGCLYAIDLTSEVIVQGNKSEEADATADIEGRLFTKIIDKENVSSDVHIYVGDEDNRINVAQIKLMSGKFDIVLGRQLITWGSGYSFNPTDIFNAKPLAASFDPGYRKLGRDAVNMTIYFADDLSVDFIYALSYEENQKYDANTTLIERGSDDFAIRGKTNVFDFDVAASLTRRGLREYTGSKEEQEYISGLAMKGSLPIVDWGIWFEGAFFHERREVEISTGVEFVEGDFSFNFEYYRNGFGESNKENYNLLCLYQGKTLGRNYFVPSIVYTLDEKWSLSLYNFYNINDKSFILGGVVDYLYNDNVELVLMPSLIAGNKSTEYGMVKEDLGSFNFMAMLKITF